MDKHIMSISRRKVSDFIRLEDGTVGNRSAFTTAALVAASSLAAMLLVPKTATALTGYCPGPGPVGSEWCFKQYCCQLPGGGWACSTEYLPGQNCWW